MAANPENAQLSPLLETLEDTSTSHTEQTDAYLSIANRLSGEDGKVFNVLVGKEFSRLLNIFKTHISHQNSDLSNAALQAMGFCVFYSNIASSLSATEVQELLSSLNSIAVKSDDKNTCTRALWVISKQHFSAEDVGKAVPSILSTLENILNKDVQSVVIAYEALNVVIRLVEQTPAQMTDEAVRWAKIIIPLVVHSAPKVRLRAATALELGVPLLLQKQQEVSALTEQLMTSKIIGELNKLFNSKNETYVLKLWPLFVKLLGKTLHRSGSFINSLLQLEELGFRNGSPGIKKIAFIAWKSLIDNFALNPDILCSSKRLKLLMQPLSSIHVRTEALALTKVEVWWYLLMRLGSQLPIHFEQVCLPLIQSALCVDAASPQAPQLRSANLVASTPIQKGNLSFNYPATPMTPKMNLNSSLLASVAFPSVHLLGVEMMLHFLLGPEVEQFASKHKLVLSLEPLQHPLISSSSFFSKHASTLLSAVQDGFITIGKEASGAVLYAVWKDMIEFVKAAMETGSKKERQGSEVLTCLLQTLKMIIVSDSLQVEKCLSLLECTVKGLPQKVLGSAAYQVANMDLLNGTPALFLIQLHFHAGILEHGVTEEKFFVNFETLVSYVFSGPTSPLAFCESVLGELNHSAKLLDNKELLWRIWSILINPLTEKVNQTNEVNQGDALEHNFSALLSALMLPINHVFPVSSFPQPTVKTLMRTWSELYKTFARCASLVTTTDENGCCEELCSRILTALEDQPVSFFLLERIVQVVTIIVDSINFSPYSTKFQPKTKAPHTPTDWAKRKKGPLGNLNSLMQLLVRVTEEFHTLCSDQSQIEANASTLSSMGSSILNTLSVCISHVSLPSILRTVFSLLTKPIAVFYAKTKSDSPKVYSSLGSKLDKLLGELLSCLGSRYTGSYDNDLLEALSPLLCAIFLHKNKQLRTQAAQFWNGSFAKAATLVYPDELKPVLSQVKVKTPLLLPGFTFTTTAEESSGPYSDNMENSQLGTKVSGIEMKSTGKRDSLLARAEEPKNKSTPTKIPSAKLKLEFSSPNTKKKILEEEQSSDFVFIPPEAKERVLTEHQKEVLRTKRVDIPTMYNNLDASQDTALFTQYTQSQEIALDKPEVKVDATENAAQSKEEHTPQKGSDVKEEEHEAKEVADIDLLEVEVSKTLNDSSVLNTSKEVQNSSNISNSSTSSDMVVGTPPQPMSRRQSFITLEKFDSSENRSFSPLSEAKFPKAKEVILVPDSQEVKDTNPKRKEKESKRNKLQAETESQNDKSRPASRRRSRSLRQAEDAEKKLEAPEQPSLKCGSVAGAAPAEEMEDNECVPESQLPQQEENVDHDKENSAPENITDFKENTPPETSTAVKEDAQLPQKAPGNPILLRRSSRRQSEIVEAVKEAATEKPSRVKEEQKINLKKIPPSKETPTKQQSEKLVKAVEKEDTDLAKNLEESSQVNKTSNTDNDEELPDSNSSEKTIRGRSRYQTRRSLQALQTANENSESDNSEPREPTGKRKRGRPRKVDGSEKEKEESSQESQMSDTANFYMEPTKSECASDVVSEVDSQPEIDGETYMSSSDNSESRAKIPRLKDGRNTELGSTVEINKTYNVSKLGSMAQSLMTEPSAGDFATAVSDVFRNSENTSAIDCPHKRSRRVKRSKGCDCCEASGREEKSFTELKSEEAESKYKTMNSSSDMQFNCTFSGPCAVSTPLVPAKQQPFFKVSATEIKSDTESELEQTVQFSKSETEEVTEIYVQTKTIEALESSTEPTTEVTEIQKYAHDSVSIENQCVKEPRAEYKQNNVEAEKENFCKTFDVETIEASTKDETCVKPEEELEDAQVIVDEGNDVVEEKDHSATSSQDFPDENNAGAVKAPAKDIEIVDYSAAEIKLPTAEETEAELDRASAEEVEANVGKDSTELTEPKEAIAEVTEAEMGKVIFEGQVENVFAGEIDVEVIATPGKSEAEVEKASAEETEAEVSKVPAEETEAEVSKVPAEETEAEVGKVPAEETEARVETAYPEEIEAEMDTTAPNESEAEVNTVPPGEMEESTVCQESSVDKVAETLAKEKTLNINEENIHLEKENSQRTCGENAETCIVPSTDTLPYKVTLSEGAKVDEDLTTAAEKCAAPRGSENMQINLGEGHSSTDSPPKLKGLTSMALANDSPSGSFSWSPSASPSTSILKKGLKRHQQEMDSPSSLNKIRRVSFADPIYQEGLADDIDRRSPVIRSNQSNSPSSRSLKMLTSTQPKIITTPTKGFVSPGSRVLGFKSSKKSLISEMTKESMPSPKESVYPALMNCAASIDVILPQITSNMWARGLVQFIRAKNIKTIGDLSTLTPSEIKTLPIRSPKISTVKKALRTYHEQQTKAKGFDEFAVLDEAEKSYNGLDERPIYAEEKLETDLPEASATAPVETAAAAPDLPAQINALSLLMTTEELGKYSGSQLFEMQEKLGTISNGILRHLQSRWSSPPHNGSV
ncbi:telomere-associated protein RIF1 isoform X4 [Rana temporaria]|uniref:telomere-associated protein RIF1 isoform X3 n=1 Tax=Rana temporaria TaxID=8407 RepID=UPI001AAD8503|nr:telomere-associated protein RIF1 isoform X3 [Rana temporaria]XP_040213934.1 telomere-associated protein RIF1 isoform X4 [Rana temporaria]